MHRFLTHAKNNTIAYIALFIALGGTSYAAANLPAGSVGTEQLHNGAVTSKKLAKHAVTAGQLDPKSIAGHVSFWAQIRADGHVVSSSPRASVTPDAQPGLIQLSWRRTISMKCATVASVENVGPLTAPASVTTAGPFGTGKKSFVSVSTFDATGHLAPESVNIVVTCP